MSMDSGDYYIATGLLMTSVLLFLLDIDECDLGICDVNAFCFDVIGSFFCFCNPVGYTGDGITCTGTYTLILGYNLSVHDFLILFSTFCL